MCRTSCRGRAAKTVAPDDPTVWVRTPSVYPTLSLNQDLLGLSRVSIKSWWISAAMSSHPSSMKRRRAVSDRSWCICSSIGIETVMAMHIISSLLITNDNGWWNSTQLATRTAACDAARAKADIGLYLCTDCLNQLFEKPVIVICAMLRNELIGNHSLAAYVKKIWGCEAYVKKLQSAKLTPNDPNRTSAYSWDTQRKPWDIISTTGRKAKCLSPGTVFS
jgi:hypothetical protein